MTRNTDTEALDRLRRIETRLMKYFEHVGFDSQGKRPTFENGKLLVPSPSTPLKDCIEAIPGSWSEPVHVYVGDDYLITLD
jgi:hypothetical protein